MIECCILLGKTQHEIENDYAFIDLPELIAKKNERYASELLEQVQVVSFPHNSDAKSREAYIKSLRNRISNEPPPPVLSAEEQYKAQLMRMRGG